MNIYSLCHRLDSINVIQLLFLCKRLTIRSENEIKDISEAIATTELGYKRLSKSSRSTQEYAPGEVSLSRTPAVLLRERKYVIVERQFLTRHILEEAGLQTKRRRGEYLCIHTSRMRPMGNQWAFNAKQVS